MPLASLELPYRAFPSRGAVPALAGLCFLAGSRSTAASAELSRDSRSLSPFAPSSLPLKPARRRTGTHEPGRRFPAVASPVASTRSMSAPHVPSPSRGPWARRLTAGKRPLRSLAPPGSPFCDDPSPGQGEVARRCSPGNLTLQSLLHHGSGFGLSRRHTRQGLALYLVHRRAPSRRGSSPRPGRRRLSSRAQDPSTRRVYRTPRITVERRPSSPSTS